MKQINFKVMSRSSEANQAHMKDMADNIQVLWQVRKSQFLIVKLLKNRGELSRAEQLIMGTMLLVGPTFLVLTGLLGITHIAIMVILQFYCLAFLSEKSEHRPVSVQGLEKLRTGLTADCKATLISWLQAEDRILTAASLKGFEDQLRFTLREAQHERHHEELLGEQLSVLKKVPS